MLVVREAYLTSEQMEQIGIPAALDTDMDIRKKIGRASCRERVCQYV